MESYQLLFLVTISLFIGYSSSYSISFRRPCHDFSPECWKNTVQAVVPIISEGIPQLGVESLDPYVLKHLNLKLSGGINVQFSQGLITGLKNCIVDFARLTEDTFENQLHCNLNIKGKYRSSGQLLVFPINGEGESTIKCNNLKIHSVLQLGSKVNSDGKRYLVIKDSNIDHSYDGRVGYNMTNLFKGNPEISKAILKFMNNQWRLVAEEFGTPIVDYGVNSVMRNIKRLFEVLSIDELNKL